MSPPPHGSGSGRLWRGLGWVGLGWVGLGWVGGVGSQLPSDVCWSPFALTHVVAATDAFTRLRGQAQSAAPLRREVTRGLLLKLHPDKATGPIKRSELRAMIEAALAAYPENQLAHRLMLMTHAPCR